MAAALAVLDVPELLRHILLHLEDWQEPFVLQRVNQRFEATIAGSLQLRRMMWLAPKPSSKDLNLKVGKGLEFWMEDPPRDRIYNPLLIRQVHVNSGVRWPEGDKCRLYMYTSAEPRGISINVFHGRLVDDSMIFRRGSSWRRMLWAQISAVRISLSFHSFPKVPLHSRYLEFSDGATIGDLMDHIQRHLDVAQEKVRARRQAARKVQKRD
ncbi:hypothetical protein B0A48_06608 [Cryoendolithus antarcticus]|uniref:F-box domain-containing protein n=1 Tax=Cryoendolithus antarcticus TaxID=1507870 RepID=A0A1V8T8T2_9PEZI|nr:hypothetical protein B0A48_06608 [Cryoendolithus antarcticus]